MVMYLSAELFQQVVSTFHGGATMEGPHAGWEHRRQPRVAVHATAVIIPLVDRLGRRPVRVGMRDLSIVGVGIIHDQPLRVREQFALRLPLTPDTPLWIVCDVT